MKNLSLLAVLLAAALYADAAAAHNDAPPLEKDAQLCYGYAMVGYDSVINARLGVPAEYALGLAQKTPVSNSDRRYSVNVLKIALNAYAWPGNPHDYAVEVMYRCAKAQGNFLDANLDW